MLNEIEQILFCEFLIFCLSCRVCPPIQESSTIKRRYRCDSPVNNRLVRTILYTTKLSQRLDVELIKTPDLDKLLYKITIKNIQVTISGRKRDLIFSKAAKAAAVSIDNVKIGKKSVGFDLQYFVRTGGGYYLSHCDVDVFRDNLHEPRCKLVKNGL